MGALLSLIALSLATTFTVASFAGSTPSVRIHPTGLILPENVQKAGHPTYANGSDYLLNLMEAPGLALAGREKDGRFYEMRIDPGSGALLHRKSSEKKELTNLHTVGELGVYLRENGLELDPIGKKFVGHYM